MRGPDGLVENCGSAPSPARFARDLSPRAGRGEFFDAVRHPAFSFLALRKSALIRVCQPAPVLR